MLQILRQTQGERINRVDALALCNMLGDIYPDWCLVLLVLKVEPSPLVQMLSLCP